MGSLSSSKNSLPKVLLVEDDLTLAFFIRKKLEQSSFHVRVVDNGFLGAKEAVKTDYDLLVLDISLPELTGLSLLKRVRRRSLKTPVIVISGSNVEQNQFKSYEKGANIFHAKPLNFNLLVTQAKSLVQLNKPDELIHIGGVSIDYINHTISKGVVSTSLSRKEVLLLKCLNCEEGRTLSREVILNKTYTGNDENGDNSIDVLISRLRKKLKQIGGSLTIETIYGKGFRLNID